MDILPLNNGQHFFMSLNNISDDSVQLISNFENLRILEQAYFNIRRRKKIRFKTKYSQSKGYEIDILHRQQELSQNSTFDEISQQFQYLNNSGCRRLTLFIQLGEQISSQGIEILFTSFLNLIGLNILELRIDIPQIAQKEITTLFTSQLNLLNLESLSLRITNKNIDDQSLLQLTSLTQNLTSLNDFQLELTKSICFDIEGPFFNFIQECNQILSSLELDLQQNNDYSNTLMLLLCALDRVRSLTSIKLYLSGATRGPYIRANYKEQHYIERLFETFKNFQYLSRLKLDLSNNLISPQQVVDLSRIINNYQSLLSLKLNLSYIDLKSNPLSSLCSSVQNKQLFCLNLCLEGNKITNSEAKVIAKAIKSIKSVVSLRLKLKTNMIDEEGASKLAKDFAKSRLLQFLKFNIENNQMKNVILPLNNFLKSNSIDSLSWNLSKNELSHQSDRIIFEDPQKCVFLPEQIRIQNDHKFKSLAFNLSDCKCSSKVIDNFATFLEKQTEFNSLELNFKSNQIESLSTVSKAIKGMQGIEFLRLNLKNNKINDKDTCSLFQFLQTLKQVKKLKLCQIVMQLKIQEEIISTFNRQG